MTARINTIKHNMHPVQGLALLLEAIEYAREVGCDDWEFAVEIPVLQQAGVTLSQIRWLVCKGYVHHGRETTNSGDERRSFQFQQHLALRKRSCLVLTEEGIELARKLRQPTPYEERFPLDSSACRVNGNGSRFLRESPLERATPREPLAFAKASTSIQPQWDCDRQELRVGDELVKEFRLNSPNQIIILATFEEEGWPVRIDDPLPPHHEIDPKQRLHDTIKSLNRNQRSRLIRFRGDGTGEGIRWELFGRLAAVRNSLSG